jgi:hypothetical protein
MGVAESMQPLREVPMLDQRDHDDLYPIGYAQSTRVSAVAYPLGSATSGQSGRVTRVKGRLA